MLTVPNRGFLFTVFFLFFCNAATVAQNNSFKLKYKNSTIYSGIEVGSKGVKMSILEVGKNAQKAGAFNILKDTSVNTDFISFTQPTFQATLTGLQKLYIVATKDLSIPSDRVFTVFSSGVKVQAAKDNKNGWITDMIDSFRLRINEPARKMEVVDVIQEARLSHLGIVPDSRRYNTFLIDIGSGNTKGGYFPNGNTKDIRLFQLTWGTKSVANATEKRLDNDKTISNFNKQLYRVLSGEANAEIVYAVNVSGAYNMSDNIAFSGGIAWSVATLLYPELYESQVIPVTFEDMVKFNDRIYRDYASLSTEALAKSVKDESVDKTQLSKEVKKVHAVFDQKSLMSGAGLLTNVMRQFEGIYEKKQFFLVKNGQVGWISAYVDQSLAK